MAKELTYLETVDRWIELKEAIRQLTAEEKSIREGLFNGTFKNPVEGTNKVDLPDGRTLKGVYKLYRNVDEKAVDTLPEDLRTRVLKVKYDLSVSDYRTLNSEERKQVDGILTVKPGLPSLEVVVPKEDK